MARHHHNHLQPPEMDHIQPRNEPHHEAPPLGQKLIVYSGSDALLRHGPSGHGSMANRSNGLPSSSRAVQYPGHRVGNPETSHVSFAPYPTGSSSGQLPYVAQAHPEPAPSYPHRSAMSSHADNRRVAMKRKNPIIDPVDGRNSGDYYVGSSSSDQFSNFVQPNPTALASHKNNPSPVTEPLQPQMLSSINPSNWNDHRLVNQGGSQRNVRARHGRANISLEPRPASAYTSSNIHLAPLHSTGSAFVSTSVERNQAPFPVPIRTAPSGGTGVTSRASSGRLYYPSMHSSSSGVAPAPTVHGSSDSAIFANGGSVPRAAHGQAVPSYTHPSVSSSSGAIPREAVIPSYPPATSTSMRINQPSTSMRINQPSPISTYASSRQARDVSTGHANSGRNRRARASFYGLHPLMVEAQRFMILEELALYESRQAVADPHWDLRLDIDEMSYEDLLALGESIGSVNTGLADDKISGCVKEVVCCSPDQTQEDEDDGSCVVCLEGYKDNDLLGVLKCGHDFHADCIKKWLQVKNACPVCKSAAA